MFTVKMRNLCFRSGNLKAVKKMKKKIWEKKVLSAADLCPKKCASFAHFCDFFSIALFENASPPKKNCNQMSGFWGRLAHSENVVEKSDFVRIFCAFWLCAFFHIHHVWSPWFGGAWKGRKKKKTLHYAQCVGARNIFSPLSVWPLIFLLPPSLLLSVGQIPIIFLGGAGKEDEGMMI